MNLNYDVLDRTEKMIYALRSLYNEYGYERYIMRKFEEYDLYSRNKDFLISDNVITFTDTNGKLMALKPDVTLSIIKNNKDIDNGIKKLCYDESIYRVSRRSNTFREIKQAGLECMGKIDSDCIGEVILLAAKSLALTESEFVIEITDLEILRTLLDKITDDKEIKKELIKCVSEKNIHGINEILNNNDIPIEKADALIRLLRIYGSPKVVFEKLESFDSDEIITEEIKNLKESVLLLNHSAYKDSVVIDFSLVGNMNYYNGVIFNGFIKGVPESVLSGGQYDKLMKKLGRKAGAVGFAVYLDILDRIPENEER